MCGIAGFYVKDPDLKLNRDSMLDTLLLLIESRGRDATGFVAIGEESLEWHKASCSATTFCQYRRWVPENARIVLGHTRYATQGLPEFVENNHPLKRGPYYIVHNGHVNNDKELFSKSDRTRYGRVDSEAIAARLSSLEDLSRLNEVMEEIEGHAAVAAVQEGKPDHLVVARGKFSPLWVYDGRVIVMFASTREAIVKAHEMHIGHLAVSRLWQLHEGEQMEWIGQEVKTSKFVLPKPPPIQINKYGEAWSWSNFTYDDDDEKDDKKDDKGERSEKVEKIVSGYEYRSRYFDDDKCDSCNTPVTWRDAVYRYDDIDKITYRFCDECAELWDYDDLAKTARKVNEPELKLDDDARENGWVLIDGEAIHVSELEVAEFDLESMGVLQERAYTEDELDGPVYGNLHPLDNYTRANDSVISRAARRFGFEL